MWQSVSFAHVSRFPFDYKYNFFSSFDYLDMFIYKSKKKKLKAKNKNDSLWMWTIHGGVFLSSFQKLLSQWINYYLFNKIQSLLKVKKKKKKHLFFSLSQRHCSFCFYFKKKYIQSSESDFNVLTLPLCFYLCLYRCHRYLLSHFVNIQVIAWDTCNPYNVICGIKQER